MSGAKGAARGAARNAMGAATGAAGISTGVARNATWISAMSAAKGAATGAANAMSAATGLIFASDSSAAWRSARSCSISSASNLDAFASSYPEFPPVISPLFLIIVPSSETTFRRRSPAPNECLFASSCVSHTSVSPPMA